VYAGLQKLANPTYLNPHNPASVVGQMQTLRHTSPIGPLLAVSLHAPTLVGLLIAFGELAVGTGALLGFCTRYAALGGMALSLTFFLTVSWSTRPYYYGSDIVFLFAWSIFVAFGAAGVLSVDAWIAGQIRQFRRSRDAPHPADLERRRLVLRAQALAVVAVGAFGVGGAAALLGRLAGGTKHRSRQNTLSGGAPAASTSASTSPKHQHPTRQPTQHPQNPPGTAIASTSALSVGQAGQFTDPKSGAPAWLVHLSSTRFAAFSAVCTHAGCTVSFDGNAMEFVCPCHGGTYDAKTGAVTGGPPPSPLAAIPVQVINGKVRVD
jgi:thiosulfate dehydrogenase [quinone] large subunit